VEAVLTTVPMFHGEAVCEVLLTFPEDFGEVITPEELAVLHEFEVLMEEHAPPASADSDPVVADAAEQALIKKIDVAIKRLHENLGHPRNNDLMRILRNGDASILAVARAKVFECSICQNRVKPKPANPASANRIAEFNQRVAVDVKSLPGWKPLQKVKALNIIDIGSSFQIMAPLFEGDTAVEMRQQYNEKWRNWAGTPYEVLVDAAQANLADAFAGALEDDGTSMLPIAGQAQWQNGKCEVHGDWWGRIFQKVLDTMVPTTRAEWLDCVTHTNAAKSELLQVYGMSPCQHVFGRNPRVPADLLQEPQHVVAATAPLFDEVTARRQAIRTAARVATIELQDSKALRRAIAARPRGGVEYAPGDEVAYWRLPRGKRSQKTRTGRWYGRAVVLGKVGRNFVLIHRQEVIRAAPEQLRYATTEEQKSYDLVDNELAGIKELVESGKLKSRQYMDLVSEEQPPSPDVVFGDSRSVAADLVPDHEMEEPSTHPAPLSPAPSMFAPTTPRPEEEEAPLPASEPNVISNNQPVDAIPPVQAYGPVRRVSSKQHRDSVLHSRTLHRPSAVLEDDFSDMMQEVVPHLLETFPRGIKRTSSDLSPSDPEAPADSEEVLFAQSISDQWAESNTVEALLSQFMHKKLQKEIPHSGNHHELQERIDLSKVEEWNTLSGKSAVKVHFGTAAKHIRQKLPHRIMKSRFVITRKVEDGAPERIKSRWCLLGHLDPDFSVKVRLGQLQSPTLSQIGRTVLFQLIASYGWDLCLGDIKGAFLEAGPLKEQYRPLFTEPPPGGIPGLPHDVLIEVTGNVYGQNDAPLNWNKVFDEAALQAGFVRSRFDSCLYFIYDDGKLQGTMGAHVDDTATGGEGDKYKQAIAFLRKRFPYRKWRVGSGDFCGTSYTQDPVTKEITASQEAYANSLRPISLTKKRQSERASPATPAEIGILRAVNGAGNWLAGQTRPDLSVQVSLSQQCFPVPTVEHLCEANQMIRRAKQNADMCIVYKAISPDSLTLCCHSDAAWANLAENKTQAGYIIGFTDKKLNEGHVSAWTPAVWKSYKLPRVVSSTLSGEAQACATATSTVEWVMLMLAEALDGMFDLRDYAEVLLRRQPIVVTDCKSLYDHVTSTSTPAALDDRRTAIDVAIIRQSMHRCGMQVRWAPTDRMLADALTKNKGDPADLLRAVVRSSTYQLSAEQTVLDLKAEEKKRRQQFRVGGSGPP
jgi:hypothetical protein